MFHFHITINNITSEQLEEIAKQYGFKPTTIDLMIKREKRIDRMMTGYGKTFDDVRNSINEFVDRTKLEIQRIKVEENFSSFDDLFDRLDLSEINDKTYIEFHFKVLKTNLVNISGNDFKVALSRNNREVDYQFYNARAYQYTDLVDIEKWYDRNKEFIKSAHIEKLILDTNPSHDNGWI